ncbi:MAG: prepilin-type N-terminal cleavage/methylation domain-containing protein [Candidatus Cloacimonetes bacterium]|jgi:prepilin-type N-terminal cleavage/methylation domain-containing protein|nr:prepilin-type N-terminal cleavage/methylation domain-containing protein [Candidatus Cloacimonadota bacterium]
MNERGVTLLEVLVSAAVLAVLILTAYIGIMYAERQAERNHQYRAATNIVSGELDRQYVYNRYNLNQTQMRILEVVRREVEICTLDNDEKLMGLLSVKAREMSEHYGNDLFPFVRVTATLEWTFPTKKDKHKVELQEDHYPR